MDCGNVFCNGLLLIDRSGYNSIESKNLKTSPNFKLVSTSGILSLAVSLEAPVNGLVKTLLTTRAESQ